MPDIIPRTQQPQQLFFWAMLAIATGMAAIVAVLLG
jgi:hypothetical protein